MFNNVAWIPLLPKSLRLRTLRWINQVLCLPLQRGRLSHSLVTRAGRLRVLKCRWFGVFFVVVKSNFLIGSRPWLSRCLFVVITCGQSTVSRWRDANPRGSGWEPKSRKEKNNVCRNGMSRVNFSKYTQTGPSILASASLVYFYSVPSTSNTVIFSFRSCHKLQGSLWVNTFNLHEPLGDKC